MFENQKRVLLVESHDLMARALSRGLEEEGFTVQIISGEDYCTVAVEESSADAILVDVSPWEDFVEFRQQWRSNGLLIPILALTTPGQVDRIDKRKCQCSISVLTKPFSFEQLVTQLNDLVE